MLANWNIIPTNLHVLGKASGAGWVGGLAQAVESQGQDSYTASQAQTPSSLLWVRRSSHFVAKYALSLDFLFLKDIFLSGELAMCFVNQCSGYTFQVTFNFTRETCLLLQWPWSLIKESSQGSCVEGSGWMQRRQKQAMLGLYWLQM